MKKIKESRTFTKLEIALFKFFLNYNNKKLKDWCKKQDLCYSNISNYINRRKTINSKHVFFKKVMIIVEKMKSELKQLLKLI